MDTNVMPFYVGVGTFGCLTLYQLHLSRSFKGAYKDKLYYYFSNLITVTVLVTYVYQILNVKFLGLGASMQLFYIEWTFATPIIMINVGRLLQISLTQYLLSSLLDISMITFAYLSYISNNRRAVYGFFAAGAACFIGLLLIFITKFKVFAILRKSSFITSAPRSIYRNTLRYRIFKTIIISIAATWIFYPIVYLLYKELIITKTTAVAIYVGLDILTKGIFTCLLLGSREIYKQTPSVLGNLTKKLFKIHPLQVAISENKLEESVKHVKSSQALTVLPLEIPPVRYGLTSMVSPTIPNETETDEQSDKRVENIEPIVTHSSPQYTYVTSYVPSMPSILEEEIFP